jgi:hypothetical protein
VHHCDTHVFFCSSHAVVFALLYPWDLGDTAAAAQQALVHGLTKAMLAVLHTLPPKEGSMSPTVLQVLVGPETMMHACNVTAPRYAPLVSAWAVAAWLA